MHAPAKHPFPSRAFPSNFIIAAAGTVSAGLGLVVLLGWYAHIPALIQLRPYLVPMQHNAALCLLFSGAGLCALNWRRPVMAQISGTIVSLLAGFTLYEYLCGFDLGIDQFLFHAYITTQTSHPGRMSPAAALCLLQIGLALLLMGLRVERKWRAVVVGSLGSVVIAICAAAIVGYATDLPGTYEWGRFTSLALHTAAGLALLGVGIFVFAWNEGREKGEKTPRWLPVPMGLGVLAISLVFSQAMAKKQTQVTVQAIKASSESIESIVNFIMEARIRSLGQMARRWESAHHLTQVAWENDAKNYANDFPDSEGLEWIDSSYLFRWNALSADGTGEVDQSPVLEKRLKAAVALARLSHEPVITRIVEVSPGKPGFIVCVPVYAGGDFEGCIAGIFQAQGLFDRYLPVSIASGYTITISEGGRMFYERHASPEPANKDWVLDSRMEQRGTVWNLRIWPTPALLSQMDSSIPRTLLFAGLVRATVLGLIIYLAQKSSAQARKTATLNRELKTALAEVRTLSGMLPICSGCKRIRDDGGYWNEIERYVSKHSDASFSHGICPECAKTFYEAEGLEVPDEVLKAVERHDYD